MKTLIGVNSNGTGLADISVKEGRIFKDNANEVIIGNIYAEDNDYKIGDTIKIDGENFEVVGISETGDQSMASGVFTSLSKVQDLMDNEDSISNIYVKVKKGEDAKKVADRIDKKYGDDIQTITSVMEMGQMAKMLNRVRNSEKLIETLKSEYNESLRDLSFKVSSFRNLIFEIHNEICILLEKPYNIENKIYDLPFLEVINCLKKTFKKNLELLKEKINLNNFEDLI